jgi:hypothetical protein
VLAPERIATKNGYSRQLSAAMLPPLNSSIKLLGIAAEASL